MANLLVASLGVKPRIWVAGHRGMVGSAMDLRGSSSSIPPSPMVCRVNSSDSSRLAALGWRPKTSLEAGIADVYQWFVRTQKSEFATA